MNRTLASLAVVAASAGWAGQALPDDMVTSAGKAQQNKVMAECMKRQSADNPRTARADMERTCQEQMRAQRKADDKMSGAPK